MTKLKLNKWYEMEDKDQKIKILEKAKTKDNRNNNHYIYKYDNSDGIWGIWLGDCEDVIRSFDIIIEKKEAELELKKIIISIRKLSVEDKKNIICNLLSEV